MKARKSFTLLFLLLCFAFAKSQDVPNSSFENWSANFPSSWISYESLIRISDAVWIERDTNFRTDGISSVLLKSDTFLAASESAVIPATLLLGTVHHTVGNEQAYISPITYKHKPDTLQFDYRYLPASATDSASFQFIFSNADSILLNLSGTLSAQVSWQTKTVVLTSLYNSADLKPDSLFVQFRSSANSSEAQLGSRLWIDNIRLRIDSSTLPSGISTAFPDDEIAVYPNPASEFLFVDLNEKYANSEIAILDLQGKPLLKQKGILGKNKINLLVFSDGLYLLRLQLADNQKIAHKRILITH